MESIKKIADIITDKMEILDAPKQAIKYATSPVTTGSARMLKARGKTILTCIHGRRESYSLLNLVILRFSLELRSPGRN